MTILTAERSAARSPRSMTTLLSTRGQSAAERSAAAPPSGMPTMWPSSGQPPWIARPLDLPPRRSWSQTPPLSLILLRSPPSSCAEQFMCGPLDYVGGPSDSTRSPTVLCQPHCHPLVLMDGMAEEKRTNQSCPTSIIYHRRWRVVHSNCHCVLGSCVEYWSGAVSLSLKVYIAARSIVLAAGS